MKINKIIEHINNNNNQSQDRLTFQNSSNNLIFNDSTKNNSICLFIFKITSHPKRWEWDSNLIVNLGDSNRDSNKKIVNNSLFLNNIENKQTKRH